MAEFKVFGSELDDSLDTSNTLMNNWPASMTSNGGHYVDGNEDDDLFDHQEGADELDEIFNTDSDAREEIQIGPETLSLAPNFCQDPDELDRIFSVDSWNSLAHDEQQRLMTFLPNFSGSTNEEDKLTTITMLLTGQNFRFGNPVDKFKSDLLAGKLSPDSVKMTKVLQKAQYRRYKAKQLNYNYTLLRDLLSSRKKILESRTSLPVKTPLAVLRMKRKSVKTRVDFDDRVAKRYFKELNVMRQAEGGGADRDSSEDENYPNGPPAKMSATQKREVSLLDSDYWQSLQQHNGKSPSIQVPKTQGKKEFENSAKLCRRKKSVGLEEQLNVAAQKFGSPSLLSASSSLPLTTSTPFSLFSPTKLEDLETADVKSFLGRSPTSTHLNSSFESLLPKVPVQPLPNLLLSPQMLSPGKMSPHKVAEQMGKKQGEEMSLLKPTGLRKPPVVSPPKPRKAVNDLEVIEEAVANIPGMDLGDTLVEDFDLDFCFDSVQELSSSPTKSVHNRSGGSSVGLMSPPLSSMVESNNCFACFFSLLREKFRSSLDYKMTVEELEEAVADWESQDYSQIAWFSFSNSWTNETRSAVAFLSNSQPQVSPPNFVPFLNCCDLRQQLYQWIGTGRDADLQLQTICQWWFDRRQLCTLPEDPSFKHMLENSDQSMFLEESQLQRNTSSSGAVTQDFHTQERERMFNPGISYTYHLKDFSVTVGPIRAPGGTLSTTPCKGKSHPLLVSDRPAFITIIVIVRDAVARLRNGEGTRQHICELVKESQFINQEAAKEEKILTSAVSGALDRLQGEADPCCKYDTSKKTWQYLHLGRSSEDFARLHNEQQQNSSKGNKGKKQRKVSGSGGAVPSPIVESLTTSTTTTTSAPPAIKSFVNNHEDVVLNAVNSILPTEPLQRSELPPASIQLTPRPTAMVAPPAQKVITASSLISSPVATVALPAFPSEPLPPVSVMTPAPTMAPITSAPAAASASVQVIQVMTSQGLKTFRLTGNKTTEQAPAKVETDPILKIQQPLPPQQHLQLQATSANSSLLRAKLPHDSKKLSIQPQQNLTRLISNQLDTNQSVLKVATSNPSTQFLQSVQRVIVKDSDGKPVQISSEAFQKWLATRNARPGGVPSIVTTQSPQQANLIRIQRPQQQLQQFASHTQSGDGSIVQVVQRPIVAGTNSSPEGQRQTVVKIQGNLGNLSQQQLQTVQLLSSGGSGTAVRLLQTSQQQQPHQQQQERQQSVVLPSRIVVNSPSGITPSSVTATPSSIVSIGGRQYILANNSQTGTVVRQQQATTTGASSGSQFIVQSSTGKQIVLTQEQLQQFQSLQNIRIVQATNATTSSNQTKPNSN